MLNESYAECLIKKKPPGPAPLIKILLAVGLLITAGSILLFGLAGFIAFAAMCAFAYHTIQNLNVEYEYLLVDKIFSVDRILNKMRRKKAAEYTLEDIQVIAPENSGRIREYDNQVKKVSDYTSGDAGAVRYAFIYTKSGAGEQVLFEPDDKMLRCIKQMAPRKMFEN